MTVAIGLDFRPIFRFLLIPSLCSSDLRTFFECRFSLYVLENLTKFKKLRSIYSSLSCVEMSTFVSNLTEPKGKKLSRSVSR